MVFSKNLELATCDQIVHSWDKNCLRANRNFIYDSFVGSCKLCVPIILVDLVYKLSKKRKLTKEIIQKCLIDFFHFTILGTCTSSMFACSNCILRNLLGKFTYSTLVFVPGCICGLSYFIIKPEYKYQIAMTVLNAALESIVLLMYDTGLLKFNIYIETIFFMATNACLMYVTKKFKSSRLHYTWFFKPDNNNQHKDTKMFLKKLFKTTINYFEFGLGFEILRMIIGDFTILAPKNIHKLLKLRTLKPGIFASSYVGLYEITLYFLNKYFKKDHSIHVLLSGFLSGLSYAVYPNRSISLSVFINLIYFVYNLINIQLLKHVPIDTMLYSLSFGILFHIQVFYPKSISKIGSNLIRVTTSKKSDLIINAIKKLNYVVS